MKFAFRILPAMICLIGILYAAPKTAHACTNPTGVAGDSMFNETSNVPAYCDGTNWIAMSGGETIDPCTTGAIGTRCTTDGAIYAGDTVGGARMYAAACDHGMAWDGSACTGSQITRQWKTSNTTTAGTTSLTDGLANTDAIATAGIADHPAAEACRNVGPEWHLPARDELDLLYDNLVDQNGDTTPGGPLGSTFDFNTTGSFPAGWYWSSSEFNTPSGSAYTQRFNNGLISANAKNNASPVRCVRRDLTQTTQIVPSDLIGHWRLDETSGTTAADSSGNGNDATLTNAGTATLGQDAVIDRGVVTAFGTGPTSARFTAANFPTGTNPPFTASMWIRRNDGQESIFLAGTVSDGMQVHRDPIRLANQSGGLLSGFFNTNVSIVDGTWTHFAVTNDGTWSRVYKNGIEQDSDNSVAFTIDTDAFVFGATEGAFGGGGTDLDDVRLYDRALTPEEVTEIYNARDGIRYNESYRTPEFFDGNKFVSLRPNFPEPGNAPVLVPNVSGCTSIGDVCADGSVYAGISPDGNAPIFATPNDEAVNIAWSSVTVTTGINDYDSGQTNQATAEASLNLADYPAYQACANASFGGHDDWYLPSRNENQVLYDNRVAIGNFTNNRYWSSTENDANNAFTYNHISGFQDVDSKTNSAGLYVRCIRMGNFVVAGTGGLVGHWKLDESTGTTAADSAGSNDGTWTNSPQASPTGAVGRSLRFDQGNNNYVSIANTGNVFTTAPFTISNWVKFDQLSTVVGGQIFMRMRHSASPFHAYEARMESTANNVFYTIRDSGGTGYNVTSDSPVAAEQWHHVVLTLDASYNATLYLNGVAQADTETPGSLYAADGDLRIGGNNGSSVNLGGNVDDVRFYDRVLTTAEITLLYNMGAPVGSSTALPAGCPTIGDVCDDGTIYAGDSPDGTVPMFTTPADAPVRMDWNSGASTGSDRVNTTMVDCVTNQTSCETGEANTSLLATEDSHLGEAGFQAHEAAQYCFDLSAHTSEDWYLPARDELAELFNAKNSGALIDTFNETGNPEGFYWSSSERNRDVAFFVDFNDGSVSTYSKNGFFPPGIRVRCVRKGPAPRCANPYGMEGDVFYNTTHNVLQYCDGARWLAIGKDN